ncbi:helix-turn-helix domain-containing protein [Propionimicrobium sp. PCR01-08-3]|uniref:helix-turn-helix domain-containing protein n=1 Tax=Propionimicrobium sp. PCR01-08-3 TaxID=3052086 RepID=UPI00255CAEFD|nr:helix-turn-helix domain-containing protein [Propionimicrobium sp. PCR01-08-3]WIY83944.1 helix-turn-helix domain-containing protein [Propionimicrobium sp. PCR01-08-3]
MSVTHIAADSGHSPAPAALTLDEASRYIGINRKTLANWRTLGRGPAYVKSGGVVVYRIVDLDAWLAANSVGGGAR